MKAIDENKFSHIKGWGIDANDDNDPTFPMKKYNGDDHKRLGYPRPPLQPIEEEVLHSNERPGVTAVFGTSSPPSGLSGAIRRFAFRYSENSWAHWLPLILADRINVIEGIAADLMSGHVPNIPKERGWSAELKYNKEGVIKKAAIAVVAVSATVAIIVLLKKKKRLARTL